MPTPRQRAHVRQGVGALPTLRRPLPPPTLAHRATAARARNPDHETTAADCEAAGFCETTMTIWTKLEEGNSWNFLYYTPVGERRNAHGMADARRGVKLTVGKQYHCMFPTGETLTVTLVEDVRQVTTRGQGDGVFGLTGHQSRLMVSRVFAGVTWVAPITEVKIGLSDEEFNAEGRR